MGKRYPQDATHQGFWITSAKPIDDRLVVSEYKDLFNWNGATFDDYVYTGLIVAVIFNNRSFTDDANGLYYLTNQKKIQYIYDKTAEEETAPDVENQVPGISNLGGWTKLVSINDTKFPTIEGDYYLSIDDQGHLSWLPKEEEVPTPTVAEEGKVLTVIENPHTAGEYIMSWEEIPNNTDYPTETGNYILHIESGEDPRWIELPEAQPGIGIKNFPGPGDVDPEGRPQPSHDGEITRKKTLSNSGEIIAADIDSEEDSGDYTGIEDERPFKLMINYEALGNITIHGGNSLE